MSAHGFPLLDLVLPIINELSESIITSEARNLLRKNFLSYINKEISYETLLKQVISYPSLKNELDKLKKIMETENQPIPPSPDDTSFVVKKKHNRNEPRSIYERNKTRHWSEYEDYRLLMGVRLFGLDDWTTIAKYVGNGRLRSQCIQRWSRGLDPRISKKPWTKSEEEKLLKLVKEYDDKSWTQVSSHFGNRSDVQCRYKYSQLRRAKMSIPIKEPNKKQHPKMNETPKIEPPKSENSEQVSEEIKNAFDQAFKTDFFQDIEFNQPEEKCIKQGGSIFKERNDNVASHESTNGEGFGFCNNTLFDDINISLSEFNSATSSKSFF